MVEGASPSRLTAVRYGGSADRHVVSFGSRRLVETADGSAVPILRELADETEFGKDAIDDAEAMEARVVRPT